MAKASAVVKDKVVKNNGFRDFERNNPEVKNATHLKVPLHLITMKKGFNPRDLDKPETQAKIQAMKQSYTSKTYVAPPLVKLAADGESVELVDGECRYTAAVLADKEMREAGLAGITELDVMRFTGDEKAALVQTFLSNEGEGLTILEQSKGVRDLLNLGLNREQVSLEIHKTIGWVDRLIAVGKLPDNIKALIKANKVAAEIAVQLTKGRTDEEAEALILSKYEQAQERGDGKVTAKHVKPEPAPAPAAPAQAPAPVAQAPAAAPAPVAPPAVQKPALAPEDNRPIPEGKSSTPAFEPPDAPATTPTVATAPNKQVQEPSRPVTTRQPTKAELNKKEIEQHDAAWRLAFNLPEKLTTDKTIHPEKNYDVKLTGATLQLLIDLYDTFKEEIIYAKKSIK